MRCASGIEARQVDELAINIDPIQVGGRLTGDAMKAVIAYGDGYSVCDNCRKPNRLDYISKPPIAEFHKDVAAWLNMDAVRTVPGARRGFQAVAHTYVHKGDPVLLTALSHYTEFLAVEGSGGIGCEIPANDQHIITPDAAALKIEEIKKQHGRAPVIAFIDHVDYQYGNMHDVKAIAKVCHQYDIPVLYNGAYTVGIMPVNGKDLGADFVVGSGHKSMAAPAPSGILATTAERAEEVLRSIGNPDSANRISNVFANGLGYIDYKVSNWLPDAYQFYWFIVDLERASYMAFQVWGWRPRFDDDKIVNNGTKVYTGSVMFQPGFQSWQWTIASAATA